MSSSEIRPIQRTNTGSYEQYPVRIASQAPTLQKASEDAVKLTLRSFSPASQHASDVARSNTNPTGRYRGYTEEAHEKRAQGSSESGEVTREVTERELTEEEESGQNLDTQA